MTTLSVMGAMSAAQATVYSVVAMNTFSRQLTATGNAILSNTSVNLTAQATTGSGNNLTFALPSGVSFATNPTVGFTTGATGAVTVNTGGAGAQSIVYALTGTFSTGAIMTLTGLQVSGLQSYISSASTATFFNMTLTFPNDGASATAPGNATTQFPLASITDAATGAGTVGAGQTIDVSSGGTRFVSGTGNQLFIPLGTVTFTTNTTAPVPNDISGSTGVSMTAQGGSVTVTGPLTGISTLYAATGVATCATAAPTGAFTVTPTASAGTLTGLSVAAFQVCAIANGSTILSNGTIAVRPLITLSNNATISGTSTTNAVGYSGNVRTMAYFVGATGGYGAFSYAVNSGATASTALVTIRRSDGATATGSLASLAAGASALYGASELNSAVGSSFLVDATSRAQVTFLFSSSSVNITGLLLNPGGTVTGFGQTFTN